jgi:ArsR family transcriptional regulator
MSQANTLKDVEVIEDAAIPVACCSLPPSLRLASAEAEQLAAMFKALGHPVRLQMVELLSRYGGQVCVCDVENQFDLSQPTISHHLKILREAGLVAAEQRGLWVYYFVQPAALAQLRGVLGSLG